MFFIPQTLASGRFGFLFGLRSRVNFTRTWGNMCLVLPEVLNSIWPSVSRDLSSISCIIACFLVSPPQRIRGRVAQKRSGTWTNACKISSSFIRIHCCFKFWDIESRCEFKSFWRIQAQIEKLAWLRPRHLDLPRALADTEQAWNRSILEVATGGVWWLLVWSFLFRNDGFWGVLVKLSILFLEWTAKDSMFFMSFFAGQEVFDVLTETCRYFGR